MLNYDHNLTAVEKGKLIDIANNEQSAITSGFSTTPDTKSTTNSQYEYKELVSILQTNVSKFVDANGEPMVVYHSSNWKSITSMGLEPRESPPVIPVLLQKTGRTGKTRKIGVLN